MTHSRIPDAVGIWTMTSFDSVDVNRHAFVYLPVNRFSSIEADYKYHVKLPTLNVTAQTQYQGRLGLRGRWQTGNNPVHSWFGHVIMGNNIFTTLELFILSLGI